MLITLNTVYNNPRLPARKVPGFADNFNRADADVLGVTSGEARAWRVDTATAPATFGIRGNRARLLTGTSGYNVALADAYTANGTLKVTIADAGTTTKTGGLAFRATGQANMLYLTTTTPTTGPNYKLYQRINGVSSGVTGGTSTTPMATGDVVEVVLNGANIIVKVNGVTIMTTTSTVNQYVTEHGLYIGGAAADMRFDDISYTP